MSHDPFEVQNYEIEESIPDHYFRTEIPNIIFELGLTPYELSVYAHLKRIAGDTGKCWRTLKSLSSICGIKETKLRECLHSLSTNNFSSLLKYPLITITSRKRVDGSQESNLISINSVWGVNGSYFREIKKQNTPLAKRTTPPSPNEPPPSPNEDKEEPLQEEHIKENISAVADDSSSLEISSFFIASIKAIKPDFTKRSSRKWLKDFGNLLKLRSMEDLKKIITWVYRHEFWKGVVLSPDAIFRNLDAIEMQMRQSATSEKTSSVSNESWARSISPKAVMTDKVTLEFCLNHVEIGMKDHAIKKCLSYNDKDFREQFEKYLIKYGCTLNLF